MGNVQAALQSLPHMSIPEQFWLLELFSTALEHGQKLSPKPFLSPQELKRPVFSLSSCGSFPGFGSSLWPFSGPFPTCPHLFFLYSRDQNCSRHELSGVERDTALAVLVMPWLMQPRILISLLQQHSGHSLILLLIPQEPSHSLEISPS